jgi:hypothetical protein
MSYGSFGWEIGKAIDYPTAPSWTPMLRTWNDGTMATMPPMIM